MTFWDLRKQKNEEKQGLWEILEYLEGVLNGACPNVAGKDLKQFKTLSILEAYSMNDHIILTIFNAHLSSP